jgi:uncharacterized protein (DUF1499 family)
MDNPAPPAKSLYNRFRTPRTRSAKKMKRIVGVCILIVILLPIVGLCAMSIFSRKPANLGVTNGRLAPCPSSPNCVSTQATSPQHRMEPIPFEGSRDEAIQRVKSIIEAEPRAKIVTQRPDYIHVEFTSAIFRFVDDVEFFFDEENRVIHFRSASRVGYSDLGVNRKRMEAIRSKFKTLAGSDPPS